MKKPHALALILTILSPDAGASLPPVPAAPRQELLAAVPAAACQHDIGRAGNRGWEADRRVHDPGLLMEGPQPALLLSPGAYRATIRLRRGHYPSKGLLRKAEQILRFEVRDAADGRAIVSRVLDVSELPTSNHYEDRWMDFFIPGASEHLITAEAHWLGGVNCEVESFAFARLTVGTPAEFSARAGRLSERVRRDHLENGFVVSRKKSGEPDETGDATTYTGFYAAAMAWRLAAGPDDEATQDLETALGAMHDAVKGDADDPIVARFVDADGAPHPASPSKDVYTAFFFGCAAAYPRIENPALKAQVRGDVRRIATRLLKDGLVVRGGKTVLASFAPYFTPEEIRIGIRKLVAEREKGRAVAKAIRKASAYAPFQPMWPGIGELARAFEKKDQNALFRLILPTADGVTMLADRAVKVLREHGRRDLIGPDLNRAEPATLRLAGLLAGALKKLPPSVNGRRFHRLSDLRVLSSNALIALHIVKTAAVITGDPTFEQYYRDNLYGQDALLQTALDWYGTDDQFIRATGGNAAAARERRGYLSLLAAYNLYQMEENPAVKESYRTIIAREAAAERFDDNPLVGVIAAACGVPTDQASLLTALTNYPESPDGLGDTFWTTNGRQIAEAMGGGEDAGYASEPLPVSVRPRDSFLWQRNSRRIVGDLENSYPGADYVFLYWMARRHGLVAAPDAPSPTAFRR